MFLNDIKNIESFKPFFFHKGKRKQILETGKISVDNQIYNLYYKLCSFKSGISFETKKKKFLSERPIQPAIDLAKMEF